MRFSRAFFLFISLRFSVLAVIGTGTFFAFARRRIRTAYTFFPAFFSLDNIGDRAPNYKRYNGYNYVIGKFHISDYTATVSVALFLFLISFSIFNSLFLFKTRSVRIAANPRTIAQPRITVQALPSAAEGEIRAPKK